jgi:hypothetical protein
MSFRFGLWKMIAGAAACAAGVCLLAPEADSAQAKKKAGGAAATAPSATVTPVSPVESVIEAIVGLQKKAATDVEDEEYESAATRFAVIAELVKLQTLRDNAELKAWAAKTSKVFVKGADPNLTKDDAKEVLAAGSKLVAEAEKNIKKWGTAKAVAGMYTPANPTIKPVMEYVSQGNGAVRRFVGLPGARGAEGAPTAYALAELGVLTHMYGKHYKGEADWNKFSDIHRDSALEIAKKLAKGDGNGARSNHADFQANCKSCHDKYQANAPNN